MFTYIGDPLWFEKANPSDSPEQLMDIGSCQVNTSSDGNMPTCVKDDGELTHAPYLSPTLASLKDSGDLYSHWEKHRPDAHEEL